MIKLKIGLYKHKETGEYDVMIDSIDNFIKIHNGNFEKIKVFEHQEKTEKDKLKEECYELKKLILHNVEAFIIPVFQNGVTSDFLDDKKINLIRENLYKFMCARRKLLEVNEFLYN